MPTIEEKIEKIKSGNYHIGHLLFDHLIESGPDEICTIDAGTGETETYESMLKRIVHLARCMQALGLQPGDVLVLAGSNHIHLRIPFYAAMMNGLPVSGIDPHYRYAEIKKHFELTRPRIAFCQQNTYDMYSQAARDLGIDTKIITFDDGGNSMTEFMKTLDETPVEDFQPPIFDTNKVYAWLVTTSGTTGKHKVAAIKHFEAARQSIQFLKALYLKEKSRLLNVSTVQWISGFCIGLGVPLLNWTLIQSSLPNTDEHIIDIINEYKPTSLLPTPLLLTSLLTNNKPCDLTCFNSITYGGAPTFKNILQQIKQKLRSDVMIREAYGQTEVVGLAACSQPDTPSGSCGKPFPQFTFKLVDVSNGKEITEPNKQGELWIKGPSFDEYYKNPEETANTITKDGWVRTGDLFYMDQDQYFFFIERINMVIEFRTNQVVPLEIEEVIQSHESVKEVCVTSIMDEVDIEHPVACVVRRPGCQITPEDIKALVADKLTDSRRLRGGVMFMEELLKTASGKLARGKIRDFVRVQHALKPGLLQ